jgi:predicted ATPase
MLEGSIASFLDHQDAQYPTFFDRGLPDTLGYAQIIQLFDQRSIQADWNRNRYEKIFSPTHGVPSMQLTPNASRPSVRLRSLPEALRLRSNPVTIPHA